MHQKADIQATFLLHCSFFSEIVVNIWNSLPVDTDFSSRACFIKRRDGFEFFTVSLHQVLVVLSS